MKSILTLFILVLSFSSVVFGRSETFCRMKFGSLAELTLVPPAANRGGVADGFSGAERVPDPKAVKPSGFKCLVSLDSINSKCPEGMKKSTENKVERCLSKEYALKELCPSEIEQYALGMAESICKPQTK